MKLCSNNIVKRNLNLKLLNFNEAVFFAFFDGAFLEAYIKNIKSDCVINKIKDFGNRLSIPIEKSEYHNF